MLKAIIFDMDGVLIDSMPYHADSWISAFDKVGINATREDIYSMEGSNSRGMVKKIFSKNKRTPEEHHYRELPVIKREIFFKIREIKIFDEIYPCLKLLKNKYKLAVVSGSDQKTVSNIIGRFFPEIFEVVISGSDVNEGKPSAEPYLKAIRKLNVNADESMVIENAPFVVEAAKNAGIYCIAIPTYIDSDQLKKADLILENHSDLKEYFKNLI